MNDLNDQQKPTAEGLPELCYSVHESTGAKSDDWASPK